MAEDPKEPKKEPEKEVEADDKKEESNPADADFDIKDKADLIKKFSALNKRIDELEKQIKSDNDSDSDGESNSNDDDEDEYSDLDELLR